MKKLLMFFAGYDYQAARLCPVHSQIKYSAFGATVLSTVLVACFGSYHVASDIAHNLYLALGFAMFWGGLILIFELANITLFNNESKSKYLILFFRIIISIAISLLLTTPFVLMMFQDSLSQKLNEDKKNQISVVENNYIIIKTEKDSILNRSYEDVKLRQKETMEEAEGISGTKKKGMGDWFAFKKAALDSARVHYNALKASTDKEMANLLTAKGNDVNNISEYYSSDYLAQVKALIELVKNNKSMLLQTLLIFIVLLILDLMPILLKTISTLGSPNDPYNRIIKERENAAIELATIKISQRNKSEIEHASTVQSNNLLMAHDSFKFEIKPLVNMFNVQNEYNSIIEEQFKHDPELIQKAKQRINRLFESKLDSVIGNKDSISGTFTIADNQRMYVADSEEFPKHHPFAVNNDIINTTKTICKDFNTPEEKCNAIYNWIHENVPYDNNKDERQGYRTAIETFNTRSGVCGELTALLVSMLRLADIKTKYIHVTVDYSGKSVLHACAGVTIDNKFKLIDVAYHNPNIDHKEYKICNDQGVLSNFEMWNKV